MKTTQRWRLRTRKHTSPQKVHMEQTPKHKAHSDSHTEVQSTHCGSCQHLRCLVPRVQSTQPATLSPAQEPHTLTYGLTELINDYPVSCQNGIMSLMLPKGRKSGYLRSLMKQKKFLSVYFSSAVPNQAKRQ